MRHGYADGWTTDGVFRYFGEGQEGDMRLAGGNRAIANTPLPERTFCCLRPWAVGKYASSVPLPALDTISSKPQIASAHIETRLCFY
jgi:hypothetical protein